MSERPIAVGDLVMLLSCESKSHNALAGSFRNVSGPAKVLVEHWTLEPADYDAIGRMVWLPRHLKRIPPLSELEGVQTQEPLRVPTKERV